MDRALIATKRALQPSNLKVTKVQSAAKVPKIVVSLRSIVNKKRLSPLGRSLTLGILVTLAHFSICIRPIRQSFYDRLTWPRGPEFL